MPRVLGSNLAPRVQCFPLDRVAHIDIVLWGFDPSGIYYVRSRYKVLLSSYTNRSNDTHLPIYNKLWTIALPAKIKITTWRILHKFIPSYYNLYYRRVWSNPLCPQCLVTAETGTHL